MKLFLCRYSKPILITICTVDIKVVKVVCDMYYGVTCILIGIMNFTSVSNEKKR